MRASPGELEPSEVERIRELPRWVERYAHNRTLPGVIFLAAISVMVMGLVGLGHFVDRSLAEGDRVRAGVFVVALAGMLAALLWFRFVSGARLSRRGAEALYGAEGSVLTEAMEQSLSRPKALSRAHFLLLFCVLAWLGLLLLGLIPRRHLLPTSALFLVPFTFYFYAGPYRGLISPFMLLYPTLYGLHAVLLSLGAPIYISGGPSGSYEGLNLIIPILGYALMAALVAHLYSRLALWRVRALAHMEECER
jgi:hypothetical protein